MIRMTNKKKIRKFLYEDESDMNISYIFYAKIDPEFIPLNLLAAK